jgi:signal transduction histidine kinase
VTGDRIQLQPVLMNLIMNSIEAMKDVNGSRDLAIKLQRSENEQLAVSVSDTGVGLPPQQADQIFNAFFTTKPHGTGMGLRISRSIIKSHGGRLWSADNSITLRATRPFTTRCPPKSGPASDGCSCSHGVRH